MTYREFFESVTGRTPFPFQERYREATAANVALKAPTGLGKTDTVLTAWLHRVVEEPTTTARRLVWCLPGRALTEQIARTADKRVKTAGIEIRVCRLLGGSADNDMTITPDEHAIFVG